jgi:hypothetical protein
MLRHNALRIVMLVFLLTALGYLRSSSTAAVSIDALTTRTEITISERDSNEYSPDVAYNPNHNEYLVVWENVWVGGHHDIYAQRISGEGKVLSWFAVASGTNKQMNPSVAYDPTNDRYLVVWAYDFWGNDTDWDIYGRFIPWNGPNVSLQDFSICDWTSNQRRPVVAYALSQQEFLVTWTNAPSGQPTYISARRVYADGSGFPAGGFLVSSGPEDRDFQDVTYNLARNEYLVTWDVLKSGSGLDIWGIRLSATGSALLGGNPPAIGEFAIAGWPAVEELPAAAACSQADQYLVAWQSDQDTGGTDTAIYARYINGDGVPGDVVMISDTTLPQRNVDIACNAVGRKYLLVWQDMYVGGLYGVWARTAYPDESLEPEFGLVGPHASANREYPAAAGGRSTFLTAWEHDRDGGINRDIHGRLLGYVAYIPLVVK